MLVWKGVWKNIISYYSSAFTINTQPRRRSARSRSVLLTYFGDVVLVAAASLDLKVPILAGKCDWIVAILLRVLAVAARMSLWRKQVIKCWKLYHFAIERGRHWLKKGYVP